MRMPNLLSEIGVESSEAFRSGTERGAFPGSALELIRRCAFSSSTDTLKQPPPALLHSSKRPTGNFLYGVSNPRIHDAAYQEGFFQFDEECAFPIGSLMIDLCKGQSRPAIVYLIINENKLINVFLLVQDAPLGAMEADLFECRMQTRGAFERAFVETNDMREETGVYIRSKGFDKTPSFMWTGVYHIIRSGPLPFLRLRESESQFESSWMKEAFHEATSSRRSERGYEDIGVWGLVESSTGVELYTVFQKGTYKNHKLQHLNPSSDTMRLLAITLLQHAKELNHWGLEEVDNEEEEESEFDFAAAAVRAESRLRDTEEKVEEEVKECEARMHPEENVLENAFSSTMRSCDLHALNRDNDIETLVLNSIAPLFCPEEEEVVRAEMKGSLDQQLRALGKVLCPRQAVMVCLLNTTKDIDMCILAVNGPACGWKTDIDDMRRLLLCPWATVIVVEKEGKASVVRVAGVTRERLRLATPPVSTPKVAQEAALPQDAVESLTVRALKRTLAALEAVESTNF